MIVGDRVSLEKSDREFSVMEKFFRLRIFPGIFLAILCLLVYFPTFRSEFKIDDFAYVGKSIHLNLSTIGDLFSRSESQHFNPIDPLLNNILFKLFRKNVVPFHLVNLALFYVNCLFLFRLCFRMTKRGKTALWTAVLFCLHPINAEIVNQIVFSSVLLAAALCQLGLICYDRYLLSSQRKDYWGAFLSIGIACLTLETSWISPFYFFIWAYFIRRVNFIKAFKSTIPFLGMVFALFIVWYFLSQGNSIRGGFLKKIEYFGLSPVTFLGSLSFLLFWYWQKLFIPIDVIWIYAIQPLDLFWAVTYLVIFAALIAFFWMLWKKFPLPANYIFAGIWFLAGFIFLLPASLVHPDVGLVIEPYWFYIGSMGFFIFVGMLLTSFQQKVLKVFFYVVLAFLCGYLFFYTQRVNTVAKTEKSYSEYWMRISFNPSPLTALAKQAYLKQEYPQALRYYELYLKMFAASPYSVYSFHDIYDSLAGVYMKMGNVAKANEYLSASMKINPYDPRAYMIRAEIFVNEMKYAQAQADLLTAIKLNPKNEIPQLNLADLYLLTKQDVKAIALFKKLISADLRGVDRINVYAKLAVLQLLYEDKMRSENTIAELLRKDASVNSFIILSQAFVSFQCSQEAVDILMRGLKKYPKNKDLYLLIGTVLASQGKLIAAIAIWQIGYDLWPEESQFKKSILQAQQLLNNNR